MESLPGILFLAGISAFGLVIFWAITNDAPGNRGGRSGLFAIRDQSEAHAERQAEEPPWKSGGKGRSKKPKRFESAEVRNARLLELGRSEGE